MYQRPRKLAEFDLRVARAFSFILGLLLIAWGYWGMGGGEEALATTMLRVTLILAGLWCFYIAVFNRVKALKDIDYDGGTDPFAGLVVFAVLIISFLVALVLPERTNKKS